MDWSALQGVLIDLDGVVYTGHDPIPGAGGFLADARRHGLKFLLVTNNSTTAPELVAARLKGMDIDVDPHEVLTSSMAAVDYVKQHAASGARLRIIGEAGLRQAAVDMGYEILEDGEAQAEWVIAGLDRSFTYAKLAAATSDIRAGARFVATNVDALLPIEGGAFLPGAGTMVAAIRTATGVEPVVIGKPEPALFEQGLLRLGGLAPSQAAMIGDRLDTDIVGGQRAGLHSIMVLSGISTEAEGRAAVPPPDAILPDLASVGKLLGW